MTAIPVCDLFRRCVGKRGREDWQEFHARSSGRIRKAVRLAFLHYGLRPVESDCEDIVQDLYCRLLAKRRFRGNTEPQLWAYLNRAANNLVLDFRRAQRAKKRQIRPKLDAHEPFGGFDDTAALVASPEERYLQGELRRIFVARCKQVAGGSKIAAGTVKLKVLRMALVEGWTSREIAHRTKEAVTPGQIDTLVHRLKRLLEEDGIRILNRRCHREPLRLVVVRPMGITVANIC